MFKTRLHWPIHRHRGGQGSLPWRGALAALSILGLLFAFHQVVSGSVRQGELRRAAAAAQTEATWRCNALSSIRLREGCLGQLSAALHGEAVMLSRSGVRSLE